MPHILNFQTINARAWTIGTYLVSAFIVLLTFGVLFWADWYIIDDHEIINLLGARDRLPLTDAIKGFLASEVASTSTMTRFRPVYYVFQMLESMVFGKNVMLWYAARIFIFVFFALSLVRALLAIFNPLFAFSVSLFLISQVYWSDIFTRLGPGETYAVLGAALILYALSTAQREIWTLPHLACLSIGIVICAGSKENFIFLAALPVYLAFQNRHRLTLGHGILIALPVIFCLWIAFTVASRIQAAGGNDVYMHNATASGRIHLIWQFMKLPLIEIWAALIILTGIFYIFTRILKNEKLNQYNFTNLSLKIVSINFIILGIYLMQYIFYNGNWPSGLGRYNFPGLIIRDFAFCCLAYLLLEIVRAITDQTYLLKQAVLRLKSYTFKFNAHVLILHVIAIIALFSAITNIPRSYHQAQDMVTRSNAFMSDIKKAKQTLMSDPQRLLLLEPHLPFDYEPIVAVTRFIRAEGIKNPIAVNAANITLPTNQPENTALFKMLIKMIETMSTQGTTDFIPAQQAVPLQGNCYSLSMSGEPTSKCQAGAKIWVQPEHL